MGQKSRHHQSLDRRIEALKKKRDELNLELAQVTRDLFLLSEVDGDAQALASEETEAAPAAADPNE